MLAKTKVKTRGSEKNVERGATTCFIEFTNVYRWMKDERLAAETVTAIVRLHQCWAAPPWSSIRYVGTESKQNIAPTQSHACRIRARSMSRAWRPPDRTLVRLRQKFEQCIASSSSHTREFDDRAASSTQLSPCRTLVNLIPKCEQQFFNTKSEMIQNTTRTLRVSSPETLPFQWCVLFSRDAA